MSDELKQALEEFATKAVDLANQGADQIPGVLQDIVNAEILMRGMATACFACGVLVAAVLMMRNWEDYDGEVIKVFAAVGGVVSLVGVVVSAHGLFYAYLFPRLVILDYLKGLA